MSSTPVARTIQISRFGYGGTEFPACPGCRAIADNELGEIDSADVLDGSDFGDYCLDFGVKCQFFVAKLDKIKRCDSIIYPLARLLCAHR
jgi:hypothetical protein